MGMDIIAYTASPRKTPESKKDNGYIVPGTGDPDGSLPSAWYSVTYKEDLQNFLKQEIDLLVIGVPLTYAYLPPPPPILTLQIAYCYAANIQRNYSQLTSSNYCTRVTHAAHMLLTLREAKS